MDLRCFAHWVCGCANCVRCIKKQNKAVKIVFKQSRKTVSLSHKNCHVYVHTPIHTDRHTVKHSIEALGV